MTNFQKDLTPQDFDNFCFFLDAEHPELSSELPPNRAFVNGTIFINQPARMKDERYAEFTTIKNTWLKDNGFLG
jgi:hypothetical protein